ncbi:hypothetical protein C2E23DRAFT_458024 [Lenzites betulinus]|nr:hypothetical protein C2E23DRAFT_458024 [Lenzites betulinus]
MPMPVGGGNPENVNLTCARFGPAYGVWIALGSSRRRIQWRIILSVTVTVTGYVLTCRRAAAARTDTGTASGGGRDALMSDDFTVNVWPYGGGHGAPGPILAVYTTSPHRQGRWAPALACRASARPSSRFSRSPTIYCARSRYQGRREGRAIITIGRVRASGRTFAGSRWESVDDGARENARKETKRRRDAENERRRERREPGRVSRRTTRRGRRARTRPGGEMRGFGTRSPLVRAIWAAGVREKGVRGGKEGVARTLRDEE